MQPKMKLLSLAHTKVDIENYPSGYAEQWILIVPEGRKVQIDFDIFELEDSEDCKNDYVEFREASIMVGDPKRIYGYFGPILTNRLCGNAKPKSILSQGNMVWVQFMIDRNSTTMYKGLKASFKAGVSWWWVLLSLFSNAARKFFYIFSFGELELIQLVVNNLSVLWLDMIAAVLFFRDRKRFSSILSTNHKKEWFVFCVHIYL